MEYISTTALAHELDLPTSDLFSKLKKLGLIDRKNDKWILTEKGKEKGGQIRTNPKFGEFIVWPENISISDDKSHNKRKLLNSTALGENFKISSQRMNLVLSELGWVEKDVTGWILTRLGSVFNGKQFESDTSGKKYVMWPEEILKNKHLLRVLTETNQGPTQENKSDTLEMPSSNSSPNISLNEGFREKFEAKHRTIDGHYVRSKAEMLIDNWLYQYGVVHAYERKLPIEEDVYCDFYIPSGTGRPQAVYIEFWGLENDEKYTARKQKKTEIYIREGLALIELSDSDIQNIDDILPKKLLQYKIRVV